MPLPFNLSAENIATLEKINQGVREPMLLEKMWKVGMAEREMANREAQTAASSASAIRVSSAWSPL